MTKLFEAFSEEQCGGCCAMLKRLKGSFVRIKEYLEGESGELERLYVRSRKILFGVGGRNNC